MAVTLLEGGHHVTIIAEHFPGDYSIHYTSPWAGAIWRTHATADQAEQCQWDMASYEKWMDIVSNDPGLAERMGIEASHLSTVDAKATPETELDTSSSSLWFIPHVRGFSAIPSNDLPFGCKSGYVYDSIAISPPKYLQYLITQATALGARTCRARLSPREGFAKAIEAVLKHFSGPNVIPNDGNVSKPIVINCTGLGARELCHDSDVYPIRGQTVLVRIRPSPAPASSSIILHEDPSIAPLATYIVPRPGTDTFVLGGTKIPNDWSSEPDSAISAAIIERCKSVWPALKDAEIEILSEQVGLRPGRQGGVRLEVEEVDAGGGVVVSVIHQYGHAGAGYQNSIGSARKALGLVEGIMAV
ncbi:DAO-domain-containing protein [Lophiostoma macrostomum CBS 122681]|uniref:DAO-domain-containing protein n=1 Tax=Lophiostoma macrostomum CBS 122681 TaxID=1314788 RepID=A0A6A6TBC9_9PLEO|nr:DAO-domain-containing protein [Lophiostoma macrostomum CBS 122681]